MSDVIRIKCWSCHEGMTLFEHGKAAGMCPCCGVEVDLSGYLEEAIRQNLQLEAEAQALRKDKARLDRLDQLNAALNAKYGTTYQWQVIVNHNINRLTLGHLQIDLSDSAAFGLPSCRDALDTIMPGASPELGDSNA